MSLGKSASGQALGYLFQFERAIYWLSHTDTAYIAIETDDDVVAQLRSGSPLEKVYEQDKSVTGSANPFSNSNINLWKTISIWLAIQKKYGSDKCRFILATNKRVNSSCIMSKLHRANSTKDYKVDKPVLKGFYDELMLAGSKLKGKAKEHHDQIVADHSEDDILSLLSKIVLSVDEFQTDKQKFKDSIKDNLRIGSQVPFNSIYDRILGWTISKTIELWTDNKEAIIRSQDLVDIKDYYVKDAIDRPFIEQAISALPVFDIDREQQKEKVFIKQLEMIDLVEDEKIDAIDDFLRATMERDRWAANGSIPKKDDLIEFDKTLSRSWLASFKEKTILAKSQPALNAVDVGNLIYIDTCKNTGFTLGGYPVLQSYTVNGGFHILSDNLAIGWHPDWEKTFKPKKP